MKTPTDPQYQAALKVLRYCGTIANMRGEIFLVDSYAQVIKDVERIREIKK